MNKICKDCKKPLSRPDAVICKSCYNKIRAIKLIERIKTFICLDCGKKISRKTVTNGKHRCPSCATLNAFKENPKLIINISKKALKRLSKPENNGMFGKHHTEESKERMSETRIKEGTAKGENNSNWQGGIWDNPYPTEFNDKLKESIRERDSHKCQNCNMTEEQHIKKINKKLPIHHIDYNKENLQQDNLITLCNKCNCLANYTRDYWFAYYKNIIGRLCHV